MGLYAVLPDVHDLCCTIIGLLAGVVVIATKSNLTTPTALPT